MKALSLARTVHGQALVNAFEHEGAHAVIVARVADGDARIIALPVALETILGTRIRAVDQFKTIT